MGLVLGTDCGFVTVAPTADPAGVDDTVNNRAIYMQDTSPATAVKIIEMGWYCGTATDETNFEVGIYTDSGDDPTAIVGDISRTNAKGTTQGWKNVVGLNIVISSSTIYWLALQVDSTGESHKQNFTVNGQRWENDSETTLPTTPSAAGGGSGVLFGTYAVWEAAPAGFTRKIKIAGTFQDKPIKTKVSGTFEDKPIKIKVGGTFQDA